MKRASYNSPHVFLFAFMAACSGSQEPSVSESRSPLSVTCVEPSSSLPTDAAVCGETRTVECTTPKGAKVERVYLQSEGACRDEQLSASPDGPFALGEHTITVTRKKTGDAGDAGAPVTCTAKLHVVDTKPPTLTPKQVELWPPNHRLERVSVSDCVTVEDACDTSVRVYFTSVESSEPANANGDGNTDPDIGTVGCDAVELRAERSGGGGGRTYTLAVRAVDASGNATETTCEVVVPHDQGNGNKKGGGGSSGPASQRVAAPANCAPSPAADAGADASTADASTPQP